MRIWLQIQAIKALAVAALAGTALAVPLPAQGQPVEVRGKALLAAQCQRCHAIDATGRSAHEAAPPMRLIAKKQPVEHLAEALAEGIVTGHPDMPVFIFEPNQIEEILAYLQTLRAVP